MVEWIVVVFVILPLAVIGLIGLVAGITNGSFELLAIGAAFSASAYGATRWSGILDRY